MSSLRQQHDEVTAELNTVGVSLDRGKRQVLEVQQQYSTSQQSLALLDEQLSSAKKQVPYLPSYLP